MVIVWTFGRRNVCKDKAQRKYIIHYRKTRIATIMVNPRGTLRIIRKFFNNIFVTKKKKTLI